MEHSSSRIGRKMKHPMRWLALSSVLFALVVGLMPVHAPVKADTIQDLQDSGVLKVDVTTGEQPSQTRTLETGTGPQDVRVFGTQTGFFGIDPRTATAGEYVNIVYKFSMAVIGFFAVAAIMFGAVGYILSGGSEEKIRSAKEIITGAISAVILALLSHAILSTIDPRLVQLTSDFGSSNITLNSFQAGKACKEDTDCKDVKVPFEVEVCSGSGPGVDARKTIDQPLVCDRLPSEEQGRCAIPSGGVERVLREFPSSCKDKTTLAPASFACKRGLVPRPVNDKNQEIVGVIAEGNVATLLEGGYTRASYIAALLPSALIEDIITDQQGQPLYGNVVGTATVGLLPGSEYLDHECLPPTENQKKYSRTPNVNTSGQACATDDQCPTFDRAATICTADGKKEQKLYPVRQVCQEGTCRLKEGSFCAQDALDLCGGSAIHGATVLGQSQDAKDPCQSGTTCLRGNSKTNNPPTYGCAKAGTENYSGTTFWSTRDKEEKTGLVGFACDQDSDCKNFEQRIWQCDGDAAKEDGTKDVELTCDKNPAAQTPGGKGTCRVKQESFCKQDAAVCGGKNSVTGTVYPCVTGTSCKLDPEHDDSSPSRYVCL